MTTTTTATIINAEQREELKKRCGILLQASRIKPTSKDGQLMICGFWIGVLNALNSEDAIIFVYLASGRYEDLVEMP